MKEADIMRLIQLAGSQKGSRLLRNNVGTLRDREGTYVQYGLCVGSSDLIGWTPVVITQEMVGMQFAVFTAIEVKTPENKRRPDDQVNFINAVKEAGGFAGFATSVKEAEDLLK